MLSFSKIQRTACGVFPCFYEPAEFGRIWSFDAVSCPGVLRRVHSIFRIVQELICAATRAVPTSSKVFARAAFLCKDGLCTTQLDLEILGQLVAVSDRSSNRATSLSPSGAFAHLCRIL